MRICYVSHSCSHFTLPCIKWFVRHGHEVHLISLHQDNIEGAINHHPWQRVFDPYHATWIYFWMIPRIKRMIRRIAPDILHAHYLTSNGMMAAASGVRPFVVSARGSDLYGSLDKPIRRRLITWVMQRADLVNPVSRGMEERILELGIPQEKVLRATSGIEASRFMTDRKNRRPGPVRIICTRTLAPVYDCGVIVRATNLVAKRGVEFELLFAATGPLQKQLEEEVARRHLRDRVKFQGGYQQADLPAMLADADIYVSSSLSDGTSISLLEAMASGLFPVVSDISANREWLKGDGDGLLFPCSDEEQLADCLARAIRDDDLRQRAVQPNRELVLAEGDRDANMQKLADRYEQLVARFGKKCATRKYTTKGYSD